MRRYHLFEWEDQPWLPVLFRNFVTDHLRHFSTQKTREPVNRVVAEKLKPLLAVAGSNQVIDLCAGAGGPLLTVRRILSEELDTPVEVLLTDLFPNVEAFKRCEAEGAGSVKACYESTTAFDVPVRLRGLRTIFTALHHFNPEDAQKLLADAAHKRQPIAVFELLERTPRMLVLTVLNALWQSFVLTPLVGRLTFLRFMMTYIIPLAPAVIVWDGVVSVLRSYTPEELLTLANGVGATDYEWEAGRFDAPGPLGVLVPTIYLVGFPRVATQHGAPAAPDSGTAETGR